MDFREEIPCVATRLVSQFLIQVAANLLDREGKDEGDLVVRGLKAFALLAGEHVVLLFKVLEIVGAAGNKDFRGRRVRTADHGWWCDRPKLPDEGLCVCFREVDDLLVEPVEQHDGLSLPGELDELLCGDREGFGFAPVPLEGVVQDFLQAGNTVFRIHAVPQINVDGQWQGWVVLPFLQQSSGELLEGSGFAHAILAKEGEKRWLFWIERPIAEKLDGIVILLIGRRGAGIGGFSELDSPSPGASRDKASLAVEVHGRLFRDLMKLGLGRA